MRQDEDDKSLRKPERKQSFRRVQPQAGRLQARIAWSPQGRKLLSGPSDKKNAATYDLTCEWLEEKPAKVLKK